LAGQGAAVHPQPAACALQGALAAAECGRLWKPSNKLSRAPGGLHKDEFVVILAL
jgi:hypothetical protein